jgi:hypothetical protein
MWAVMLSPVRCEVVCNSIDGGLVNLRVLHCGLEGGSSTGTARCHKFADCIKELILQPDKVCGRLNQDSAKADLFQRNIVVLNAFNSQLVTFSLASTLLAAENTSSRFSV